MDNWMERFEKRQDKIREDFLNNKLDSKLDLAYMEKDPDKIIILLSEALKIYEILKIEGFNYNEVEYLKIKDELHKFKYKKMEEKNRDTKESQSWEDFKNEEVKREELEERE